MLFKGSSMGYNKLHAMLSSQGEPKCNIVLMLFSISFMLTVREVIYGDSLM